MENQIPEDILLLIESWGEIPVIENFIKNYEEELFCFTNPIFEDEHN